MALSIDTMAKIICHTSHPECIHRGDPAFYGQCGDCSIAATIIHANECGAPQDPDNLEDLPDFLRAILDWQ